VGENFLLALRVIGVYPWAFSLSMEKVLGLLARSEEGVFLFKKNEACSSDFLRSFQPREVSLFTSRHSGKN